MARPAALLVLFAACGGHGGSDDSHTDADMLVPPRGCDAQDDDGDGWSNAVEIAMGTSPSDPADNPDTRHQIVFAVPYHGAPQAITAVARGVRFDAGASMIDDPSDAVDTTMFVEHVEAVADGTCSGGSVHDTNGDGIADTFDAVVPGSNVCFRITARVNDTVPPAADGSHKYRAVLQLTGDGLADLAPVEVWFVVPAATCDGGVIL